MRKLQLLTNSMMATERRCPRECFYRYEKGYCSVREADSLALGSGVHLGLKHLLGVTWDLKEATEAALEYPMSDFNAAKAEAMLLGYVARWESWQSKWKVLFVEKEFVAPLVNPATGFESRTWVLAGKLDGAVEMLDTGLQYVLEHKSSSEDVSPGSNYVKKLRMNSQILQYDVGSRKLGIEPAGCIYDILKKPTIRPLQATPIESRKYKKNGEPYANQREADETPSEYSSRAALAYAENPYGSFSRIEVPVLEADRVNAARNTWAIAQEIRGNQLSGFWPQNPDACERYHKMCQFWDVCIGDASIDDPTRFVIDRPHKELETVN